MRNTLNFLTAGNDIPLADGGLQFSKTMLAENIEKHEFFENLFKTEKSVLERITQSMRKNGFDRTQPLHVWHIADKDTEHWYLIDGYTRFAACKHSGIARIPVTVHEEFPDFNAAYRYVLSLQVNRRNLNGAELLKNVSILLGSASQGGHEGDKADFVASSLGISKRTAQRAISLEKNAEETLLDSVEKGELSVNQAYNKMQESRTALEKKTVKKSSRKPEEKLLITRLDLWNVVLLTIVRIRHGADAKKFLCGEEFRSVLEKPIGFIISETDRGLLEAEGITAGILKDLFGARQ